MSRITFFKKYIKSNYLKIILPYLIILVFVLIFQVHFGFYNGVRKKVKSSIKYEKDLITIYGDTKKIGLYNVYDRLIEETDAVIIPFQEDIININEINYKIIATNNDYLNYFIDENGSYNNYKIYFDENKEGIILNKKAFELISSESVLINGQELNIKGHYSDINDIPIIIMDYKMFDEHIKSISEVLTDGQKSFHFSNIYVISNQSDILKTIKDLYAYNESSNNFKIITYDTIFYQRILESGINNTFTKYILLFVFVSMTITMMLVINLSYGRNKNEFLLRKILGDTNNVLLVEFMIENLIILIMVIFLSIVLICIISVVASLFKNIILFPTIYQEFYVVTILVFMNQLLSAVFFQLLIPKKNIISRRRL